MPAALAVRAERQERAVLDHPTWIGGRPAVPVDRPPLGDGLLVAHGILDFAVGHRGGGDVNHDRWLFLPGEGDRDRVRAEHALGAPQGRDEFGAVRHRPSDQIAPERLQHVVARDAVMIRVADAHPTASGRLGLVHRDLVRLRADDEPEPVVAVHRRGRERFAHDPHDGPGIDASQGKHLEVAVQPRDPVRIDAAQVRRHKHIGRTPGVHLRDAHVDEHAPAEFVQALVGIGPGLDHGRCARLLFPPQRPYHDRRLTLMPKAALGGVAPGRGAAS